MLLFLGCLAGAAARVDCVVVAVLAQHALLQVLRPLEVLTHLLLVNLNQLRVLLI